MQALPNNPNMIDVVARSITLHPSLLLENIVSVHDMHRAYWHKTSDEVAAASAQRQYRALQKVIRTLHDVDASNYELAVIICADFDAMINVFNIAARLQCLPQSQRTEIAKRQDELDA